MKRWKIFGSVSALVVILVSCGGGPGAPGSDAGDDTAAVEGQGAEASTMTPIEGRTFSEEAGKDKCELLRPEDVAAAAGLEVDQIEQRTVGSACLYEWEEGSIYFGSARVHESIERAKKTFARETRDVSSEDVEAAKEEAKSRLTEKAEEGEMPEAAASAGSEIVDMMPEGPVTHLELEGVGDEATIHGAGSVIIRYGNMIIRFSGKTGGEDTLAPELARQLGKAIVANLG